MYLRFIAAAILLMAAAWVICLTAPNTCQAAETRPVKIIFFDPSNNNKTLLEMEEPWCLKRNGEDDYSWHGPPTRDHMCWYGVKVLKDAGVILSKYRLFAYSIECHEGTCCWKKPENYACIHEKYD